MERVTRCEATRASRGGHSAISRRTCGGKAVVAAVALLGVLTGIAVVGAGGRALDIRSAAVARSVAATRWNAPNDAAVRGGAATNPRVSRRVRVAYGRLPISFTPNAGQIASRARYLA